MSTREIVEILNHIEYSLYVYAAACQTESSDFDPWCIGVLLKSLTEDVDRVRRQVEPPVDKPLPSIVDSIQAAQVGAKLTNV